MSKGRSSQKASRLNYDLRNWFFFFPQEKKRCLQPSAFITFISQYEHKNQTEKKVSPQDQLEMIPGSVTQSSIYQHLQKLVQNRLGCIYLCYGQFPLGSEELLCSLQFWFFSPYEGSFHIGSYQKDCLAHHNFLPLHLLTVLPQHQISCLFLPPLQNTCVQFNSTVFLSAIPTPVVRWKGKQNNCRGTSKKKKPTWREISIQAVIKLS